MRASPLTLRFIDLAGLDRDEVRRSAGLSSLEGPISHTEGMRIWRAVERLSGDAYIGLRTGAQMTIDMLGPVGPAFSTARDLADGLRVLGAVLPHLIPGLALTVQTDDPLAQLLYRMPDPAVRHGVDNLFASVLTVARECTGERLVPERVDLEVDEGDASVYEAFYGVAPRFGAEASRLAFGSADLNLTFRGASPLTSELLTRNAGAILGEERGPTARVEAALLRSLSAGDGTLADTARLLGTSARTLQRQLADRGEAFTGVRARLRRARAEAWLVEGLSSADVAGRLGYANRASFERAFRRWTGMSPAAFRNAGG
ncbi:MAG: AraC family transcriptional regulator ligand-binding domain-containing protein [Sandaracinaceae bacterium]